MKRIFLFTLVLSGCLRGLTQQCHTYTFRKTIGGNQVDNAWDVQTNAAGNFLLSGVSGSFGTGMDRGLVVLLQPSGQLRWSVSLGDAGVTRLQSGCFTADGGSVHAGINQSDGGSSLCLFKLDVHGKLSWAKKYNNGQNMGNVARVIQCGDGGYLISTSAVAAAASPAHLVKPDTSGNVVWSKAFPELVTVQDAVAEGADDFILSIFNQPSPFVYRGTLVSVDKTTGNVNWAKYYDLPATGIVTDNIYPYAGGWLVSLLFRDNATRLVSHGFMITASDGTIKKVFRVKSPDQANTDFVTAVTVNTAGNFCFSDGVLPAGGDQDATLLEVSPTGQFISGKRYQLPLPQLAFALRATADGGIVMVGSTASPTTSYDAWIVKTDSNLRTSCEEVDYKATIDQPAVGAIAFDANASQLSLTVQDFAANALVVYPTVTDACPDPALCSLVQIKGPDSVYANAGTVFRAKRNEDCQQPLQWQVDPLAATITGSSGDSVSLRFKKNGWLYTSLAGKCKIITDSVWVYVSAPAPGFTLSNETKASLDSAKGLVKDCADSLLFSNSFTPNNDGNKDVFRAMIQGNKPAYFKLVIFNRLGQPVFTTTDVYKGWDGRYNGRAQSSGGFAWYCTWQYNGEAVRKQKGKLVLLR